MPNYSNGKIYELRSYRRPDLIYIGSTTQALSKRKAEHKSNYDGWLEGKTNYTSSFEIIALRDYYIELKEYFPCNSKAELNRREGEIIRETTGCVNKRIAGRTNEEWVEDNREKLLEYKKNYYKENKEKMSEQMKEYQQKNRVKIAEQKREKVTCECGITLTKTHLPRHKRSKVHQNFMMLCWWT